MIGKEIRSVRQLAKEAGTSIRSAIVNFGQNTGPSFCKVLWFKEYKPAATEYLFIFNNSYQYCYSFKFNSILNSNEVKKYQNEIVNNYGKVVAIPACDYDNHEVQWIITGITLLPESFEDDYKAFIKDNQKMMNGLMNKYSFYPEEFHIKRIYACTGNSKNFFEWAVNAHYRAGATINAIKRIFWWNDNYKQLVKNLSKGTITAYTSNKDIHKLLNEIVELRRDKRVNDVINTFGSTQKKILRGIEYTDDDKKVFSSFYRLSESKKVNFIKKMSNIEDANEIMRQMRHVTSTHFKWTKESFMDYVENVEGVNYEKIYENGDVILVKVKDFETTKQLAKTTNWCISKNKSYWNQYVGNVNSSEQYILFDFSQKEDKLTSIVGFTCRYNKGITNAHDFVNNTMLNGKSMNNNSLINSFISHLKQENDIYSLLASHNIDINLVAKYEKPLYEWNKESMYKYLYECVDKSNVHVLMDNGNYVVLSIKDNGVKYFLGDSYIDNIPSEFHSKRHIIFMDFGMSQYNPNRIQFSIIQGGYNGREEECVWTKNEHCLDVNMTFENKLAQFGLPYDTIKRIDDEYVRLRDAIQSFDVPQINKGFKKREVFEEVINEYIGYQGFLEYIRTSIIELCSFDYIDLFYNNGCKILDFVPLTYFIGMLKEVFRQYILIGVRPGVRKFVCTMPTQKDINRLFNRETTDAEEALKTCAFLAIDKILTNEASNVELNEKIYKKLLGVLINTGAKGSALDHFVEFMLDRIDITKKSETIDYIFAYVLTRGGTKLKDKLESLRDKSQYINERYNAFQTNTGNVDTKEIEDEVEYNMPDLEDADVHEENEADFFDEAEDEPEFAEAVV